MKYWFNGFLDEIVEGLNKLWTEYQKKKNPEYKENERVKNRIRLGLRLTLIIAMLIIIITFGIQARNTLATYQKGM